VFTGLSAFPLTPITASGVDEKGFSHILSRLTEARVDSMGILGSTGSYAYLTREQRKRVATLAKQHAGDIPVMVCVGRSVPMPSCIWQMMRRQQARCPVAPGGQLPVTP
jgi:4-hydroxy-tetrahydrodipicolinate synthase